MTTNHQRVTEGLDILTRVLAPYVAAELRVRYADEWWDQGVLRVLYDDQKRSLPPGGEDEELILALGARRCLIDAQWNELFRRKLGCEHRTWSRRWARPATNGRTRACSTCRTRTPGGRSTR